MRAYVKLLILKADEIPDHHHCQETSQFSTKFHLELEEF